MLSPRERAELAEIERLLASEDPRLCRRFRMHARRPRWQAPAILAMIAGGLLGGAIVVDAGIAVAVLTNLYFAAAVKAEPHDLPPGGQGRLRRAEVRD